MVSFGNPFKDIGGAFDLEDSLLGGIVGGPGGAATAGIVGELFGGGGADFSGAEDLAELQAILAGSLFKETSPLRKAVLGDLESFIGSGELPTDLIPALAPLRRATEAQFGQARENIIGRSGARGGQLSQALIDLEGDRAQAIGALEAPLRFNLFQMAQAAGLGQVPTIQSGLGAAGATATQLASIEQAQLAAQGQAFGGLASTGLMAALLL